MGRQVYARHEREAGGSREREQGIGVGGIVWEFGGMCAAYNVQIPGPGSWLHLLLSALSAIALVAAEYFDSMFLVSESLKVDTFLHSMWRALLQCHTCMTKLYSATSNLRFSAVDAIRYECTQSLLVTFSHLEHLFLAWRKRTTRHHLMQMQKLRKPPHSRILCPLEPLLLLRIVLVGPHGKPVHQAGEVLVIVFDIQAGDDAVRVRFQLRGQLRVMLRGENLNGDSDGVDFLLCEKGRVRG